MGMARVTRRARQDRIDAQRCGGTGLLCSRSSGGFVHGLGVLQPVQAEPETAGAAAIRRGARGFSPDSGPVWPPGTLTCGSPRVSYRIQAFFWNPSGGSTGGWCVSRKSGVPAWIVGEGLVEQEADGSWVEVRLAGANRIPAEAAGATGTSISESGQRLGRADSNGQGEATAHSRRQILFRRPVWNRFCLCPERLRSFAARGA
jgi:hypothetical protein